MPQTAYQVLFLYPIAFNWTTEYQIAILQVVVPIFDGR